jgi:multiple sugar transport system ATP-binding protein
MNHSPTASIGATAAHPAVRFEAVTKRYGQVVAVDQVGFDIAPGTLVTLLGPSGCGMTTTLRLIAGLEQASDGRILIDGTDVTALSAAERDVSMVFQSYALFPHMDVMENVSYGLRAMGLKKAEAEARAAEKLSLVGLSGYEKRQPSELSGGQQQRVAVARAIVLEPKVLLFDEPLSNLDAKLRVEMRTEIKRLHDRLGTTIVYVTHDQVEAMTLGTKVAVMKEGVIQQLADPQTVYEQPANTFVAGFIGSPAMNFLAGTLEAGDAPRFRYGEGPEDVLALGGARPGAGEPGRPIVAGIRPESLHAFAGYGPRLSGIVDVVEPTGPDTHVVLKLGEQPLTARLGPRARPQRGEDLTLTVDTAAISLFDPETGLRL